jgi:hypothetical protein
VRIKRAVDAVVEVVMRRWWSRDSLCGVMSGASRVKSSSVGSWEGMRERIVGREIASKDALAIPNVTARPFVENRDDEVAARL